MGIFENTILVNRKVSAANVFGRIISLVFCILCALLSILPIAPLAFLVLAILLGAIYYLLYMDARVEYEYSYIEGRLSFARIKAKSKRRELVNIEMEEMLMIAPVGAKELTPYYSNIKTTKKDYTSGNPNPNKYEAVFKHGSGIGIVVFEPNRNMLELIQSRYASKVVIGGGLDGE